jgi:BirA family transcriptional regulator, biotin operon repressor / biotin---[acetyl-CoA-carboxylase] ligase
VSALGRPRLHLRTTDSTNLRARALALAGAPHGTLVTASEQSAGRGRQGRTWTAPPGRALLMTILLRDPPGLLPLLAAVAVSDVCGRRAAIKWPNDVLLRPKPGEVPGTSAVLGMRKVAGILVEGRPQERWAVVGIGLNVAVRPEDFPDELRDRATSLGLTPEAVEPVLERLLAALDARLASPAETLEVWRSRDALRGREISWNGGSGTADGIDDDGRLRVVTAEGVRSLDAGEVHLGLGGAS